MTAAVIDRMRPRPTLAAIVATIGPASDSPEMVGKLLGAGVGVFRLNFSHGDLASHAKRIATIRAAAAELKQPVAILGDLQGPKIRVGMIDGGIALESGQDVAILTSPGDAHEAKGTITIPSGWAELAQHVKPGERVLINDGAIRLMCVERAAADGAGVLRCRVMVGGLVTSRKGINLPDTELRLPALTEQDVEHACFAVAQGLDFLALSFVRSAQDVRELKQLLAGVCAREHDAREAGEGGRAAAIPVIAKIEKPQALEEIDEIVDEADGVMVARGDLGVEMDLADVPIVQKRLIAKCDEFGKPCIVATQMLETMITASTPTRAEVSDVANAIIDGADAVMLSAETATGAHPALVVETMRRVIESAEREVRMRESGPTPAKTLRERRYPTAALAHGAWYIAHDVNAAAVVCWSQAGGTARYLSQTGLVTPIVAYSSDRRALGRMALLRGVTSRHMDVPREGTLEAFAKHAEKDLIVLGWVSPGEKMLVVAGLPLGVQGATSGVFLWTVGQADRAGAAS